MICDLKKCVDCVAFESCKKWVVFDSEYLRFLYADRLAKRQHWTKRGFKRDIRGFK